MEMTICVECRHCLQQGDRRGAIWYNFTCAHPALERLLGIDYVTGQKCYWALNSLGQTICVSSAHPYCRDINNGECQHYSPRLHSAA
jgi:hypothetical protein